MVDYNRQVREAIHVIDAFAEKGKFTEEDIAFHVKRSLGFGNRFTQSYLRECFERKFFSKDEGGVISVSKRSEE